MANVDQHGEAAPTSWPASHYWGWHVSRETVIACFFFNFWGTTLFRIRKFHYLPCSTGTNGDGILSPHHPYLSLSKGSWSFAVHNSTMDNIDLWNRSSPERLFLCHYKDALRNSYFLIQDQLYADQLWGILHIMLQHRIYHCVYEHTVWSVVTPNTLTCVSTVNVWSCFLLNF